jgi:flagellar biosynthesis GTPase FlhF
VAWTVAMTAVGTVVGINFGTSKFSEADADSSKASVVSVDAGTTTRDEMAEAQARIAAQNRQAELEQATKEAARRRALAVAKQKAQAAAKAEAERKAAAKAEAAEEAARKEAARKAEDKRPSRSETRPPINVEPGSAKAIGRAMAADRGWGDDQFSCLEKLWDKESRWRVSAKNPSSGAYGIPQALPGDKMASVASDWKTNPRTQIEWGLRYIKSRYTTPCGAWDHFLSKNWY